MPYEKDFYTFNNKNIFVKTGINEDVFSVIIENNRYTENINTSNSVAIAAKPLVYTASVFGSQLIRYTKRNITQVHLLSKLYCLSVVLGITTLICIFRPVSWKDTRTDIPLNILTKTYGLLNILEAMYSVIVTPFANSYNYVQLFKKLEAIDKHYGTSKVKILKIRIMSIFFVLVPIAQVMCTFWLRKFQIENIGAHLTFFLLMLQGAVFSFFIINIYIDQLLLNKLLSERISGLISKQKGIIYQDTICVFLIKKFFNCSNAIHDNVAYSYCWFEIMQIYDKLADCVQLFNNIYSGQVFIMYNSWLLCTLLIICRSLSPTIKNFELFWSDLFLYSCLNTRPLILATVCEFLIRERKKTLSILVQILIHKIGDAYFDQIRTMIMLVESRTLEISANVYTVNVPTVMNYAGRIISYSVLIIEYFYKHMF